MREVGELVDLDQFDVALQRQEGERQRVGAEARAAARRVERAVAAGARVEQERAFVGGKAGATGLGFSAGGDHVDAGGEQRRDLGGIPHPRHVHDALGGQREHRRRVGGGGHAGSTLAAQLAGVDPRLRRVVHQHAHQLEVGMPEDRAQRRSRQRRPRDRQT